MNKKTIAEVYWRELLNAAMDQPKPILRLKRAISAIEFQQARLELTQDVPKRNRELLDDLSQIDQED